MMVHGAEVDPNLRLISLARAQTVLYASTTAASCPFRPDVGCEKVDVGRTDVNSDGPHT